MYHYVYRLDRPPTGQFYVGIRSCKQHPTKDARYLGSGHYVRNVPQEELVKTILVIVQTREEAARIEAELVDHDHPFSMNLCAGGNQGVLGMKHSEEWRRENSRRMKGNRFGKSLKGIKRSDETKRKMSEAQRGNKKRLGTTQSQETREKISRSMRNRR